MKSVVLSFIMSVLVGSGIVSVLGYDSKLPSFLAGAGICLLNGGALYITWKRILAKKNLVLSSSVIVIKYPLLGLIIYVVLSLKQIDLMWFLIGLSILFPTSLLAAVWLWKKTPKNTEDISLKIE